MQRIEPDLEDLQEIELDLDNSNSLSNDFYLDDAFDVDIDLDSVETTRFYGGDGEHSSYIEPTASDSDNNVKIVKPRNPSLLVDVLDNFTKEEQLMVLNDTLRLSVEKITTTLTEMQTKLNFNDNVYTGNQLEILIASSDKFGGKVKDEIIQEIYANKSVDPKELFYRVNPNSNNEAEYLVFLSQFNKIKEILANEQAKVTHLSEMNKKSTQILLMKLLDLGLIDRMYSNKKEIKFVRKFYSTGGLASHFKCECCSSDNNEHKSEIGNFIYIINISGRDLSIVLPLECNNCGTFHLLDKTVLESTLKGCASISNKLKTTRNGSTKAYSNFRSVMSLGVYNPSRDEVTHFLKKYHIEPMDDLYLSDDNEIDIDLDNITTEDQISSSNLTLASIDDEWEKIKAEFYSTIKVIGDSKFKLYPSRPSNIYDDYSSKDSFGLSKIADKMKSFDDTHLKNITKIFSTMHGNYSYLKNMSVSSCINLLKPLGLNRFSLTSKSFYKIYSMFDNLELLGKRELEFLSEELGFRIYDSEGKLDKSVSDKLFSDINDMNDNFEEKKRDYINSLYSNLYFLSYMPISTDKLLEEDINDYLYDDEIKLVIDRISDFMILNHIAEEWLSNFNPALKNNSEDSMLISSKRTILDSVKAIRSVNRKKTIWELIVRISQFISEDVESIMRFIDSGDSLNYLCSFIDACYSRDLYEMYRCYSKIDGSFQTPKFRELRELFQLISTFDNKTVTTDKFSFYFPTLDCDNKYKARFVRLFEKKGFVPKKLIGETEEEMLEYYDSLNDSKDSVNYMPDSIKNLLNAFSDTIKYSRFISYSGLYKDFGVYYSARDILYSLVDNKVNMDIILKSLNLNPSLASMLLEDEYEFPAVDDLVVKYIDLINLPLGDSLDVPSGTLKEKILFLIENYDDVKPMFKQFPKVYDYLIRVIGEE